MKPDKMRKAMGKVTALADSSLLDDLRAMHEAKQPKPEPEPGEGGETEEAADSLTPDEVAKLKAMLAQE